MSVSLWCEEVEEQSWAPALAPGGPPSPLRAQWDPSATGGRVIQRLLLLEGRYAPAPLYVGLVQRAPQRREELSKWTLEVTPPPQASRRRCGLH